MKIYSFVQSQDLLFWDLARGHCNESAEGALVAHFLASLQRRLRWNVERHAQAVSGLEALPISF